MSVVEQNDHVVVELRNGPGLLRQECGRYLIAANGSSSAISKALDIALTDYGFDEPWVVIDGDVNDESLDEDYLIMYCEAGVLRCDAPDSLLDTYQREREPHVRAIIEQSVANGRYICVLDPVEAAARDERMRELMRNPPPRAVKTWRDTIQARHIISMNI